MLLFFVYFSFVINFYHLLFFNFSPFYISPYERNPFQEFYIYSSSYPSPPPPIYLSYFFSNDTLSLRTLSLSLCLSTLFPLFFFPTSLPSLPTSLSLSLSLSLSVCLFLSVSLSLSLSLFLSLCLSLFRSLTLSLSVSLSACLPASNCLSLSLSLSTPLFLFLSHSFFFLFLSFFLSFFHLDVIFGSDNGQVYRSTVPFRQNDPILQVTTLPLSFITEVLQFTFLQYQL